MATTGEALKHWKQTNRDKVRAHEAARRERNRARREAIKAAAEQEDENR
jgi:hypothetical protein